MTQSINALSTADRLSRVSIVYLVISSQIARSRSSECNPVLVEHTHKQDSSDCSYTFYTKTADVMALHPCMHALLHCGPP